MHRRRLLALASCTVPPVVAGCGAPTGGGDTPADGTPVRVASRAGQPEAPVTYGVEMVDATATGGRPARLRVTVGNPTDAAVTLGEERDVQFHHVASDGGTLYLHPAGGERGPVESGCWRLTEFVAVPEYYGTVTVDPGETVRAESFVYGHPDLPADVCLPDGEHRIRTTGVAVEGDEFDPDAPDAAEFEWGFSLGIGE